MITKDNYKKFMALALYSGENMTVKETSEFMARRGMLNKAGNPYDPKAIRTMKTEAAEMIFQDIDRRKGTK